MRGLKRVKLLFFYQNNVRTFTGAWIETSSVAEKKSLTPVRTFTGAWIETKAKATNPAPIAVRTFTGAWIETQALSAVPVVDMFAPSRVRGLKRWQDTTAPC